MRLSFVGELGWELHIPKDACMPVYRAVMAAGAKHGIINSGYRAIDSLSIEKGNLQRDGSSDCKTAIMFASLTAPPLLLNQATDTGTLTCAPMIHLWRRG